MSLYNSASFLFMAAAGAGKEIDDASKVYNVKPAPVVSSGGAAAMSGFGTSGTDADNTVTISGDTATFVGDGTQFTTISKNSVFEDGKNYKIVATVSITSGEVKFQSGGGSDNENIGVATSSGTFTFFFAAAASGQNGQFIVARRTQNNAFDFTVSNISIFEVDTVPVDFTMVRGSNLSASRVTPEGLIETGVENLFTQSNNFTDSDWTQTALSTITKTEVGIDGTPNTAWLFEKSSMFGKLSQAITTSGLKTFSVFAKKGSLSGLHMRVDYPSPQDGRNFQTCNFNLTSGIAIPSSVFLDTSIEDVGNGWFRCSCTFNTDINDLKLFPNDSFLTDTTDSGATSRFDSNTGSILLQNAQLEIGPAVSKYVDSGSSTGKGGVQEDSFRIDHKDNFAGMLIEPRRKNLVLISEGVPVSTNVVNTTLNFGVSPDGRQRSLKVEASSANQNARIMPLDHSDGGLFTSGTKYALSCFIKNVNLPDGAVTTVAFRTDGGTLYRQGYEWTGTGADGVLATSTTAASGQDDATEFHGVQLESYGNGWWRVGFVFEPDGTAGKFEIDVNRGSNNASLDAIETWGWQIEEGQSTPQAPYHTSYIPCFGTRVERLVDIPPILDVSSLNITTACTIFLEASIHAADDSNAGVHDFNRLITTFSNIDNLNGQSNTAGEAATGSFRTLIYAGSVCKASSGNAIDEFTLFGQHRVTDSGGTTTNRQPSVSNQKLRVPFKCAFRINGTSLDFFVNGSKIGDTLTIESEELFDFIDLVDGSNDVGHKLGQIALFGSSLSDNDCRIITSDNHPSYAHMAHQLGYTNHE